jgi:Holliday junction resolvase RusA-like endonuclease
MICLTVTGTEKWVEYYDVDNITKAVFDCFNGIVLKDDRKIYSLLAEKGLISTMD